MKGLLRLLIVLILMTSAYGSALGAPPKRLAERVRNDPMEYRSTFDEMKFPQLRARRQQLVVPEWMGAGSGVYYPYPMSAYNILAHHVR
ncbi:hypothetical protein L596_021678 [Steinernema carpocapsae]|uniref:Uncharacterized protein n=1 Tax=Steinernema carpocapsae TaxID=34508 RepID=A0A4U5MKA4_STECR|nr:hypothetical protein L596_021678 [Steinernema carpocapsae]